MALMTMSLSTWALCALVAMRLGITQVLTGIKEDKIGTVENSIHGSSLRMKIKGTTPPTTGEFLRGTQSHILYSSLITCCLSAQCPLEDRIANTKMSIAPTSIKSRQLSDNGTTRSVLQATLLIATGLMTKSARTRQVQDNLKHEAVTGVNTAVNHLLQKLFPTFRTPTVLGELSITASLWHQVQQ